jgi:hypothetical protein
LIIIKVKISESPHDERDAATGAVNPTNPVCGWVVSKKAGKPETKPA